MFNVRVVSSKVEGEVVVVAVVVVAAGDDDAFCLFFCVNNFRLS